MKFSSPVGCLRAKSDFSRVSLEKMNACMHGDQRLFPLKVELSEVVCWQPRYEFIFLDNWSPLPHHLFPELVIKYHFRHP